ncbi:integrase [Ancylobacter sonchi]|uniref:DUF6460 domain-containing protein n=1 Tax=Ancylobacter TaxID=99 RepID=UPI001BD319CD|nr:MULTISPECIES: DUF6460 domain-containing protein [Ancylobacter]MBS7536904.1 integrase [Ancylobacter sonchi]MCB4770643.1 DUF6460 domain-containing protein [Ancylobacter sp. Lp-2]
MSDNQISRLMGGSPLWVLVRLVILSVVIGVIMSALGLDPLNILESLQRLVHGLFGFGFEAVEKLWRYFLLGAVVVVPLWLIMRVAQRGK